MALIKSWLANANNPQSLFPLNNLPCGVFSTASLPPRCGMALGDQIIDVTGLEADGILTLGQGPYFNEPAWNKMMAAGPALWSALRTKITTLFAEKASAQTELKKYLTPQAQATLHLPFVVAEYTDFYASRHHATNVGTMFRGAENALPPNWLHIPIGYNGRASSVVVSGTKLHRPWGQLKGPNDQSPRFAPSQRFDMEIELGAIVGVPSTSGQPVTVQQADDMIFGYVLLNDWSARDIQAWEYQPLGPFQAKATATTISPWIVMKEALEPFRTATPPREVPLLPYLKEPGPMLYEIKLEAALKPAAAPQETIISRTSYAEMYYSAAQQLAHHTTSGCAMRTGDLLGSGTISGPEKENRGSLLELSWGGKEPLTLNTGETRSFMADDDTITIRGHCQGEGYRIGFGECSGQLLPALENPYTMRNDI